MDPTQKPDTGISFALVTKLILWNATFSRDDVTKLLLMIVYFQMVETVKLASMEAFLYIYLVIVALQNF